MSSNRLETMQRRGSDSWGPPRRVRARQSAEWLPLFVIILATFGMFAGSPRLVGADEPMHQATAWYVLENGTTPTQNWTTVDIGQIPGELQEGIGCLAFKPEVSAGCLPPRAVLADGSSAVVYNYPPVYYVIVGLGQRLIDRIVDGYADLGARIFSTILNVGVITLIGLHMRRKSRDWAFYLLVVTTPTVAFYWAVVNPSGWEITTAIAFAYVASSAWWARRGEASRILRRSELATLALSSVALALSRPGGLIWLGLIALAVVAMGRCGLTSRGKSLALIAVVPGMLAGIAWSVTHRPVQPMTNPSPYGEVTLLSYLNFFQQSLNGVFTRLQHVYGNLGWLDTPMPDFLLVVSIVVWTVFLTSLTVYARIPKRVFAVGALGAILVPSALEMLAWNEWPGWWQGRYSLPFLTGFALLLLLRFGHVMRRHIVMLAAFSALTLSYMVGLNVTRYAFGIRDFLPIRFTDPGLSLNAVGAAYGSALMLLALSLLLMVASFRVRKPEYGLTPSVDQTLDRPPTLEQECQNIP